MIRLALMLAALPCAALAQAGVGTDAVAARFVARSSELSGPVVIQYPAGGDWTYTANDPDDARPVGRFAVGKLARTEYTLFSAEEEAALWKLRETQLAPPQPPVRPGASPRKVPVQWPHVVLRSGKTCVPAQGFADADDWPEHLTCWSLENHRVE